MREVMAAAERARLELDSQIADTLLAEHDSAAALLLAEVHCRYFLLKYYHIIITRFFHSYGGRPVDLTFILSSLVDIRYIKYDRNVDTQRGSNQLTL